MKSELKQERYGLLKIQGLRCRDWKLLGIFLRKLRDIYMIMYINSRAYLQRSQAGLDLKNLIDLGGFCKIARHRTNLMVTGKGKGLDAKQPGLSSSFDQERAGRERRPCPAKSPVTRRPRSAGETLNGERTRGSRIRAHRRRGWKGVAGFRRGGTGGICGQRRRFPWPAALWHSAGFGNWRR
jgi:hypothetical protein